MLSSSQTQIHACVFHSLHGFNIPLMSKCKIQSISAPLTLLLIDIQLGRFCHFPFELLIPSPHFQLRESLNADLIYHLHQCSLLDNYGQKLVSFSCKHTGFLAF